MTGTGSAELREVYEGHYRPGDPAAARHGAWRELGARGKADHVLALARRLPEPPVTVAEVGCGDGVLLSLLAQRGLGRSHHGYEISESAVELAARRPEVDRAERFDGRTLPVPGGAFDLGVLSHVLEHVPEPVALLREAGRACRAVVVEVPLEDNRSASRPEAERGREEIGHLHRFSRADVHALVARAGMSVHGELADPLPRAVHTFFARTARQRARGLAKAAARRSLFKLVPGVAERAFTLHYACLCLPGETAAGAGEAPRGTADD